MRWRLLMRLHRHSPRNPRDAVAHAQPAPSQLTRVAARTLDLVPRLTSLPPPREPRRRPAFTANASAPRRGHAHSSTHAATISGVSVFAARASTARPPSHAAIAAIAAAFRCAAQHVHPLESANGDATVQQQRGHRFAVSSSPNAAATASAAAVFVARPRDLGAIRPRR